MGHEVGALEQAIDIVGALAFHTVGRIHEGCVFGRGPVEFGDDVAAQLGDGGFDLLVEFRPLCRGVVVGFGV